MDFLTGQEFNDDIDDILNKKDQEIDQCFTQSGHDDTSVITVKYFIHYLSLIRVFSMVKPKNTTLNHKQRKTMR